MTIRTITCHDVYNYGASLQAFALQHYLERKGHDVKIIDYKPDYLSGHYSLSAVNNSAFDRPLIKQLYLLAKLPGRIYALKRKAAFDSFTSRYLYLTHRYNSYEELKADPPIADAYVAGSDQIWNTLFKNGRDKSFYLDFGDPMTKRISYAASFATTEIVSQYRGFVSKELLNFDKCSIREKTSLSLLCSLGRNDGMAVCDPVFLLTKKEWDELLICEKISFKYATDNYILVYLTDRSEDIKRIALQIKALTEWKIFVVGSFKEKYADKCFDTAGPMEFVNLIKNARFIISNSFHATAFSLIYEKNFFVVNRTEGINVRMKSILESLGLENRLSGIFNAKMLNDINYYEVNDKMGVFIDESKEWLKNALKTDR